MQLSNEGLTSWAGKFTGGLIGPNQARLSRARSERDSEKCAAVFRKDHAQSKNQSAMTI
jgi:hypothetical protein